MFTKLFGKKPAPQVPESTLPTLESGQLRNLMSRFPIGSKIRYYPEYKQDIILDSVVIAYMLNDCFIYAHNALSFSGSGTHEHAIHSHNNEKTDIGTPENFYIVIPSVSRSEGDLNYNSREILQQTGGLAPGNAITVMGGQIDGKVPVIETTVNKRTTLKEGYYANQSVALLEVATDSFLLSDQRAHQRLRTHYPVKISQHQEGPSHDCTLLDFADHAIRIDLNGFEPEQSPPGRDQPLIIRLKLSGADQLFVLRGHIFRREGAHAVVVISSILNQGTFQPIHLVDILEIKSNLLQISPG